MKIEWGNAPQWVSALCAIALAALAIYGLFFSATSQALVSYLQSELAVRNQRITGLEQREHDLQNSIANARNDLALLSEQKTEIEKQVDALRRQQEVLADTLRDMTSALSKTEFAFVREKIGGSLKAVLGDLFVLAGRLGDELSRPEGTKARDLRPWDIELHRIEELAKKLPETERKVSRAVIDRFIEQCARYRQLLIQIPALKMRDGELAQYGFDRDKHPAGIRIKAATDRLLQAADDLDTCFQSVTP